MGGTIYTRITHLLYLSSQIFQLKLNRDIHDIYSGLCILNDDQKHILRKLNPFCVSSAALAFVSMVLIGPYAKYTRT